MSARHHQSFSACPLLRMSPANTTRLTATASLPIRRVVEPEDVAALAVHIMINTALTGAIYDIDGGQQFVPQAEP